MADSKNVMKEDDGRDQEELVIVEDKAQLSNAAEEGDDHDEEEHDDPRPRNSDEDDVNPDDPDDKEREAIRERRRLEKLERKERREKAIQRDKIELDFLRKQNEELERRLAGVEQRTQAQEINDVQARIAQAAQEIEMAEKVIAKAVAAGNGEDVTQALKYRDQARERLNQLSAVKQQFSQRASDQPRLDDRTLHHAQQFLNDNKWYDPQGRDEDSAIVLAIDAALVRDGYDPKSEEYWAELRNRAARRLPERFRKSAGSSNDDASSREERRPRGGPAVGSGREHAPPTTRREIYISPERKQALIEAGVWDDPVLRAKYVKRYAEYDRQSRS